MLKLKTGILLLLMLSINLANAQNLNSVATAAESASEPLMRLIKWALRIGVVIGGSALAISYANNKNESKEHLSKWLIGLIIVGVILIIMENK